MTIAFYVLLTPLFALLVWQAAESRLERTRRARRQAVAAPLTNRPAKSMARAGSR